MDTIPVDIAKQIVSWSLLLIDKDATSPPAFSFSFGSFDFSTSTQQQQQATPFVFGEVVDTDATKEQSRDPHHDSQKHRKSAIAKAVNILLVCKQWLQWGSAIV